MQKFMIKASYSTEGIKGVQRDGGTGRVAAVEKAVTGVGGRLESFYFAFGTDDVYVVADLPDNESAMALAAAVGATGALSHYETVVLSTPEQVDRAVAKVVDYRAPGA